MYNIHPTTIISIFVYYMGQVVYCWSSYTGMDPMYGMAMDGRDGQRFIRRAVVPGTGEILQLLQDSEKLAEGFCKPRGDGIWRRGGEAVCQSGKEAPDAGLQEDAEGSAAVP